MLPPINATKVHVNYFRKHAAAAATTVAGSSLSKAGMSSRIAAAKKKTRSRNRSIVYIICGMPHAACRMLCQHTYACVCLEHMRKRARAMQKTHANINVFVREMSVWHVWSCQLLACIFFYIILYTFTIVFVTVCCAVANCTRVTRAANNMLHACGLHVSRSAFYCCCCTLNNFYPLIYRLLAISFVPLIMRATKRAFFSMPHDRELCSCLWHVNNFAECNFFMRKF